MSVQHPFGRRVVPCVFAAVLACLLALTAGVQAQQAPAAPASTSQPPPANIERAEHPFQLVFFNRPIMTFRARLFGRSPEERADAAHQVLEDLVALRITGPVEAHPFGGTNVIAVGGRSVFVLTPADADELTQETLDSISASTVANLQRVLTEALEARSPRLLLTAVGWSLLAIVGAVLLVWLIRRLRYRVERRLVALSERQIERAGVAAASAIRATRLLELWRGIVRLLAIFLSLFIGLSVLTFSMRQFPYTRPWGESMRGFLIGTVSHLGLSMLHSIPALFTVFVIFAIARFFVRLMAMLFGAVEQGNISIPYVYQETAQPTRRLVTGLLWIFALVIAYPYMPGSGTEAFKGASVFVGLIISLGSSGLVNQMMSSFMITYSRALRLGDYVRIGDVEGTVVHVGVLSTKIKTPRREEVTIPNAVVVGDTTTNYSRFAESEGVLTPTSITIGYDVPWRQVQSMLLIAASRTPGIRKQPAPRVLQAGLRDSYVEYTLLVSLERADTRALTLNTLHSHILDVFNEHGVQIMSPNYEGDPESPKIVPKDKWFSEPAAPDA